MSMTVTYVHRRRFVRLEILMVAALALPWMGISDARAGAVPPFEYTFQEPVPGVWVGVREDSPRLPVIGNTTFVVGEDGVVVFDGGGVPMMSEQVIEQVRSLTDRPVTHVVISHWHGDHNLGIYRFLEEYPGVQIIGSDFTRRAMLGSPMDYARSKDRVAGYVTQMEKLLDTGKDEEGNPVPGYMRDWYQRFLDDADLIDREYRRARITPPTMTFDDRLVIHSGSRTIELLFLGAGNTAGDIVMWLPREKLVAAGDMVVAPTPYGYNVPPRAWAETLRRLEALDFDVLVPGHGPVQHDRVYVDLLIETAASIADQRDELLAQGMAADAVEAELDFSGVLDRYTHGDPLLADRFEGWFAQPFRKAAMKALTGEPMVVIEGSKVDG